MLTNQQGQKDNDEMLDTLQQASYFTTTNTEQPEIQQQFIATVGHTSLPQYSPLNLHKVCNFIPNLQPTN